MNDNLDRESMTTAVADSYSGQLAMYKAAVEEISGKPVSSIWVHYPIAGAVVPLVPFEGSQGAKNE